VGSRVAGCGKGRLASEKVPEIMREILQKLHPDINKSIDELLDTFNDFKKSEQLNQYKDDARVCIEALMFVMATFVMGEINGMAKRTKIVLDNGSVLTYEEKMRTILDRYTEIQQDVIDRMSQIEKKSTD
jgi:hypothetical protein